MHNDIINQLRMRAAHMALDVLPQDLTVDSRPADNSQTDSPIGPVFKCWDLCSIVCQDRLGTDVREV